MCAGSRGMHRRATRLPCCEPKSKTCSDDGGTVDQVNIARAETITPQRAANRVLALCGGVGGVKLVLGLDAELGAGELTVVVNTADDFEHLGLCVSPDLDTVLYTLAGL